MRVFVCCLFLALAPVAPGQGSLSGREVVVSAGHGYYFDSASSSWLTQRSSYFGLTEDFITVETAMDFLIPYLENAGARVHFVRPRSRQTHELVRDNDVDAGVRYTETGTWTTTAVAGQGWASTDYRYATVTAATTAVATWDLQAPADGRYPVYAWWLASGNRSQNARFEIAHSGGSTTVLVDQQVDGSRWRYLGTWHFEAGGGSVSLSNQGSGADLGRVVIADAVRAGDGMGDIDRGGGVSGQPRWRESARYWLQELGAPASVYDALPASSDRNDDILCRPFFADWQGGDCYVSLHTNGAGGTGTETYMYSGGAVAGSMNLRDQIHAQVVGDLRAQWDAGWVDRGVKAANFGELRECRTMPSTLVELAFHDRQSPDNDYLHEDEFRDLGARAIAKGVIRHFDPMATIPPLPPRNLRIRNTAPGRLTVTWEPTTDPIEGAAAAPTGYLVHVSPNALGFDDGTPTATTSLDLNGTSGDVVWVRVVATNAGGRSMPTEVLAARLGGSAPVLLVNGFDRLDRSVTKRRGENTFDYSRQHGLALANALPPGQGFDAATNEAVATGAVPLGSYVAIDWILGEESTVDETFSATEQATLGAYLAGGGGLFVTGAELAWDLGFLGSAADQAFLAQLGATYAADDAGVYEASSSAGGIYDGLGTFLFDDGSRGSYDVDFPDVLTPTGGAVEALRYTSGGVAALALDNGTARVVVWGFPFETLEDPTAVLGPLRDAAMERTLQFLGVATPAVTCGDCNDDATVDVLDALVASRSSAGLQVVLDPDFARCNVFGTPGNRAAAGTTVDVLDALAIARFTVGLSATLSCTP